MVIHIAIRMALPIPTWQVRGAENKVLAKKQKYNLQKLFKKEWGMTIDTPCDSGKGNTNCGNTGRRFFSDPTRAAQLTGVSKELIERLGVLLCVINSGYEIEIDRFDEYCKETANLYVDLYKWFYMPQLVHRLLVHSKDAEK